MSDLVAIGALWKSKDKDGKTYLSGKMGDARLLVFENKFKEKDSQPDFRVYVTAPRKREDEGTDQSGGWGDAPDDDVPF